MITFANQYEDDDALIAKKEIDQESNNSANDFYGKGLKQETNLNLNDFSIQHAREKENAVVWMLTTYPPKECGIATFSQDLREAVWRIYGNSVPIKIAVIDNKNEGRKYPVDVLYNFDPEDAFCYSGFTSLINDSHTKAFIVQHEFGLFPEKNHHDFLDMLRQIKKPVLMVMHTVIPSPVDTHKRKTIELTDAVTKVIVMTERSAEILQNDYHIPSKKIEIIPHGTHLLGHSQKNMLKEKLGLKNRTVLSTFGLISRNKNIETSLKALPSIIEKFPEVVFLVLGCLHPEVFKKEGDTYYRELEQLVKNLQLSNHVKFINHYLPLDELMEYLQATDIYLFTSKDPAQAVSGTFAYALSAGCAIVSTPIPHAKELLRNGIGLLFEFQDPQSLSTQILRYLKQPAYREEISRNALELMANTAWENTAIRYIDLLTKAGSNSSSFEYRIPDIKTDHLEKLTTDLGILQFGHYNQPELSSGYTLDDNARALITVSILYEKNGEDQMLQLAKLYLQFINDCQLLDGKFINYRNEDGSFSSENENVNLEDSNGRAVWALGYVTNIKRMPKAIKDRAERILFKALPNLHSIESPRSIGFIIKGWYYYHLSNPSHQLIKFIGNLSDKLSSLYQRSADKTWKWFESYCTYANSILPEALLVAYQVTSINIYKQIARESFDFLLSKIFTQNQIKVIPNNGWLHKGEHSWKFGEQPIDVAYTILALDRFYRVYKEESYAAKLKTAFNWFLGQNHLKRIIYNPATGGCFDGLEETSVNLNQGAESTVSYLIARLTVDKYYEKQYPAPRFPKTYREPNLLQ